MCRRREMNGEKSEYEEELRSSVLLSGALLSECGRMFYVLLCIASIETHKHHSTKPVSFDSKKGFSRYKIYFFYSSNQLIFKFRCMRNVVLARWCVSDSWPVCCVVLGEGAQLREKYKAICVWNIQIRNPFFSSSSNNNFLFLLVKWSLSLLFTFEARGSNSNCLRFHVDI